MDGERQNKKISPKSGRIEALDLLRGGAMVLVVIYHILYDLKFIYRVDIPAAVTPGSRGLEMLHTGFLWVLFGVSGICAGYSRSCLKRGAALYLSGFGITVVTAVFMPSELIVFGVISCFGACMVITGLISPVLEKIPWQWRLGAFILLWIIFAEFHIKGRINLFFTDIILPAPSTDYLYPVGIKTKQFRSADYFPLIPYIFMFLAGNSLYAPVSEKKLPKAFYGIKSGFLGFIGRHTLIIYIVHQPLLLLLLDAVINRG